MGFSRKAISQKNSTAHCSGLNFEGCATKAVAEFPLPTKSKLSQTLKDQCRLPRTLWISPCLRPIGPTPRREGNAHPWRGPRPEAKLQLIAFEARISLFKTGLPARSRAPIGSIRNFHVELGELTGFGRFGLWRVLFGFLPSPECLENGFL